ncbi:MAG: cytochrome-c peroxidase [bacterium]|jgi:cytochrome c peroxidase
MKQAKMQLWLLVLCMLTAFLSTPVVMTSFANEVKGTPLTIEPPLGLPPVPVPADNPMTVEKVELGKMLYFDKRLSEDNTLSCATCHMPEHGYAEPRPVSLGIHEQSGTRNANSVINTAYATSMFWDGREKDLEAQAAGPVENPIEMGANMDLVAKEIAEIPEYKKRFHEVFGQEPSKENITKALAAFERTILSGNSAYDQFQSGDKTAMSEEAQKGMVLFNGRGLCASCHTPPVFSNWGFYNAGVGMDKEEPDLGRMTVTNQPADKGAFRVPSLRDITDTAPYFHDGSVNTLKEAVTFMARGGKDNPNRHPLFRAVEMQNLTDEEIDQLVAFLESLSGEYPVIEEPDLPLQ